jgi:DNA-directed RNA polymerase specialized sigma24 family protein
MGRRQELQDGASAELARAFEDVHRPSLAMFAFLFMLGDCARADRATDAALRDGARRVADLRHPERAAAWLRRHIVRSTWITPHRAVHRAGQTIRMGGALTALAALNRGERTVLIADVVEGLDHRDVGTIVDRDPRGVERLLARATAKYRAAWSRATSAHSDRIEQRHAANRTPGSDGESRQSRMRPALLSAGAEPQSNRQPS